MITGYEAYTDYPVGLPYVPDDAPPAQVSELGHAVQTIGGLNGMITEMQDDLKEGVIDIGAAQVWNQPMTTAVVTYRAGSPVYYDPATGGLTLVAGALEQYGKLVRAAYSDTLPFTGGGGIETHAVAVTN